MTTTNIEWTDKTWNPVTGCSKVSPGCANCYAEGVAERFWAKQYPLVEIETGGPAGTLTRSRQFTDVLTHADRLDQPLRWKKPARIFVNSMSDLFHEDVPFEFIDQVFAVMALAPQHTFQVLTKRAARMAEYLDYTGPDTIDDAAGGFGACHANLDKRWPLPNVWLGVSVENQHFADERIPLLLQTPAAQRFLSCEPLLEGLDLAKHRPGANQLWVIVGGESGAGARPCQVWWVSNIVGQCRDADVPVFVKQLGAVPLVPAARLRHHEWGEGKFEHWQSDQSGLWRVKLRDKKGGDMSEWPEHLRVREFPQ